MHTLLLTLLLAVQPASADVLPRPPDCERKAVGEACRTKQLKAGACEASTCSKLDYSHGTPPSSVEYACSVCVEGGKVTVPGTKMDTGLPAQPAPAPAPAPTAPTAPADEPLCGLATGAEASFGLTILAMSALFGRRRRA